MFCFLVFLFLRSILFGTFIVSIFRGVSEHVLVLRRQLDHADTERLNVLAQLVFGKLRVLRIFQYVLVFYSIMELVVHLIIDVGTNQLNTTMVRQMITDLFVFFLFLILLFLTFILLTFLCFFFSFFF